MVEKKILRNVYHNLISDLEGSPLCARWNVQNLECCTKWIVQNLKCAEIDCEKFGILQIALFAQFEMVWIFRNCAKFGMSKKWNTYAKFLTIYIFCTFQILQAPNSTGSKFYRLQVFQIPNSPQSGFFHHSNFLGFWTEF